MVITGAVYFWTTRFHDGVSIFVVGLVSKYVGGRGYCLGAVCLLVLCCAVDVVVGCSAATGQLRHDVGRRAVLALAWVWGVRMIGFNASCCCTYGSR